MPAFWISMMAGSSGASSILSSSEGGPNPISFGFSGAPVAAIRAVISASCSGVTPSCPCPMPKFSVSPSNQGSPRAFSFQAGSGTRPLRPPVMPSTKVSPNPNLCATSAILLTPVRRAIS